MQQISQNYIDVVHTNKNYDLDFKFHSLKYSLCLKTNAQQLADLMQEFNYLKGN